MANFETKNQSTPYLDDGMFVSTSVQADNYKSEQTGTKKVKVTLLGVIIAPLRTFRRSFTFQTVLNISIAFLIIQLAVFCGGFAFYYTSNKEAKYLSLEKEKGICKPVEAHVSYHGYLDYDGNYVIVGNTGSNNYGKAFFEVDFDLKCTEDRFRALVNELEDWLRYVQQVSQDHTLVDAYVIMDTLSKTVKYGESYITISFKSDIWVRNSGASITHIYGENLTRHSIVARH